MNISICVAGAGTMGSGIALAAAQHGFKTLIFDINKTVLAASEINISRILEGMLAKQKITEPEKEKIQSLITYSSNLQDCKADLIVEAIVENPDIKIDLFKQLAALNTAETILASNTSSLSITAIQKNIPVPERVLGMHFFNPAYLMKLVEVVKGNYTSDTIAEHVMEICRQMKKTPVLCTDMPGFIVNRIARPYYLEAMHLVENNLASIENVDAIMESRGFKMGPFKLMDLIGLDINLAVSQSVYKAMDKVPRFKPSPLQEQKVKEGKLGRKTGQGFYDYQNHSQ